jgi:hypothetical protein
MITNEQRKERNLTVPTGMSFLFSTSVFAILIPQRIPKQMPMMRAVAKYVRITLINLQNEVVLKFSQ